MPGGQGLEQERGGRGKERGGDSGLEVNIIPPSFFGRGMILMGITSKISGAETVPAGTPQAALSLGPRLVTGFPTPCVLSVFRALVGTVLPHICGNEEAYVKLY